MSDGDGRVFARRHRKSWREIFSRTCRPFSSRTQDGRTSRMYWSEEWREGGKAESSAAIFLFFFLAFVKTIASLPSLRSSPLYLHLFRHTRSISFFLCVRLTDKVPPALILKKSLSLLARPIYPWRRRREGALTRTPTLPSVEGARLFARLLARPPCLLPLCFCCSTCLSSPSLSLLP